MKTRLPRRFASASVLALGLPLTMLAQTTPSTPPAATEDTDPEVVELSPFIIPADTDRGYIAVDALAGGRTNTPIKITPAAISSLTRTFITDLGIQNVREALQWSPNVVPTDPNAGKGFGGQAFHSWSYNFRGVGAGQQGGPGPTRNYFSFFENADAYNIERVEFTRGPNSILFGLGTAGGTLSTYTKVPRIDKSFLSLGIIADDHGSLRYEADYNVAASEKFAIRVNALHDSPEGWRKGDEGSKDAIDLAFLYKLTDRTTVRLELEAARIDQTLISSTITDKSSGWDGTTASATWSAAPTGGTARTVHIANAGGWGDWLNPFPVYAPALGDKALMFWGAWNTDRSQYLGGWATTSALVDAGAALNWQPYEGWYPDQIKLPWESTWSSTTAIPVRPSKDWTYGHGLAENDYEDATITLDHKFNESVDLQVAAFIYDTETSARDYEGTGGASVDINRQLPDGTANPNYGKLFADFFLSKQTQKRSVDEIRAQLNYKLDFELAGSKVNQLFGLSAASRTTEISARQYLAQIGNGTWTNSPADWVHNMVWGRLYLDQPNSFKRVPESIGGYNINYMPKADGYWFDFDDRFELTSYALFSQTRMFEDSLSIALGVRNDNYDERVVSLRRGPNLSDQIVEENDSGTTYTAGAVYYFNWLGVFANYSQNILPPNAGSQPYISGARPGPEENQGYDFGFRVSTDDGKYYATLSRYETKTDNRNVENPVGLRSIWQNYNIARGDPQDNGFGSLAYSDTTAMEASGYELEVTANPTTSLRIQASYALPDTEVVDFYPMSRAHVNEYLSTWETQLAATADPTHAANLRNSIATAQNTLAQSTGGLPQQGTVDYTASVFANYTFDNEVLKGWSFGAGASFIGEAYLLTANGDKYYSGDYATVNAVIAYDTKIDDVAVRVALNVDNLLDYDDPIVTSYHWGYEDSTGRRIRDGYYFQNPRTFRLSARFTF